MAEQERRVKVRNSIALKITSILSSPSFTTQHNELRDALTELRSLGTEASEQMKMTKDSIVSKLEGLQSQTEVDRLFQLENFTALSDRVRVLRDMGSALKDFITIDSKALETSVHQQLGIRIAAAHVELQRDVDDPLFLVLSHVVGFLKIQDVVAKIFDVRQVVADFDRLGKENRDKMVEKAGKLLIGLGDAQISEDVSQKIAKILIKGYALAVEFSYVENFKQFVRDKLLNQKKSGQAVIVTSHDIWKFGSALSLFVKDEDSSVSSMARAIIEDFSEFKTYDRQMFNKKAGHVNFQQALQKLRCDPVRPQNSLLNVAFDAYNQEYEKQVNRIIELNNQNDREMLRTEMDQCLSTINGLATRLEPHRTKLGSRSQELGQLLGLICGQYSYMDSHESKYGLEKDFLLQPHDTQILGILRLLSVDHDSMANHLIQINTGEGKSIALGFTAIVLAKLGYHVDVVCYSEYLSLRDFGAFQKIFRRLSVLDHIHYSDFSKLSNRILSEGVDVPNIRHMVQKLIQRQSHQKQAQTTKRPKILLLDEVDVFFSDSFYGRLFRPSEEIHGDESFGLVKYVWDNRGSLTTSDSDLAKLMGLKETAQLVRKYPGLSNGLLRHEFTSMIRAAAKFTKGEEPRLLPDELRYVTDGGRIIYLDDVSGVRNSAIDYGYTTCFTYLLEVEKRILQLANVKEHVKMRLVCGGLLYSMIPTFYAFCLGMTGTLDCLTPSQKDLLKEYRFDRCTYLPSTFDKKPLNELLKKENPELTKTQVIIGNWEDYFQALIDEITREFIKGRAILMVWEDEDKLKRFDSTFRNRNPIDHNQVGVPLKLVDELNQDTRQSVVIQATKAYNITLMTRTYGRGTDLVCRDNRVTQYGGVHLILTFFPQDESEGKQIFGRTCRQDDPGSGRIILFEPELKYMEATEIEKNNERFTDWDPYLEKKRNALLESRFNTMRTWQQEHQKVHNLTLSACSAIQAKNWAKAEAELLQVRDLPVLQGQIPMAAIFLVDRTWQPILDTCINSVSMIFSDHMNTSDRFGMYGLGDGWIVPLAVKDSIDSNNIKSAKVCVGTCVLYKSMLDCLKVLSAVKDASRWLVVLSDTVDLEDRFDVKDIAPGDDVVVVDPDNGACKKGKILRSESGRWQVRSESSVMSAPKDWVQAMWKFDANVAGIDPEMRKRLLKAGARVGDVTLRYVGLNFSPFQLHCICLRESGGMMKVCFTFENVRF